MGELSAETVLEELREALSRQEYVETVKLQKNAVVDGKVNSHQIDLYWEFNDGGLTYKTLINAPNINAAVTRSDIIKMADIVHEVYGQSVGVLFTAPVYDKDVRAMAENAGIILCDTDPPLPEIWDPVIENFRIDPDQDFVKREKERLNITEELSIGNTDIKQLFLYNEKLECMDTLGSVVSSYINSANPEEFSEQSQSVRHTFQESVFLQTGRDDIPFVKLLGISFDFKFKLFNPATAEDRERENDELIRYILYNIARYIRE